MQKIYLDFLIQPIFFKVDIFEYMSFCSNIIWMRISKPSVIWSSLETF